MNYSYLFSFLLLSKSSQDYSQLGQKWAYLTSLGFPAVCLVLFSFHISVSYYLLQEQRKQVTFTLGPWALALSLSLKV